MITTFTTEDAQIARQLPELSALQEALKAERLEVRRAAADILSKWVDTSDVALEGWPAEWETMTIEQLKAVVARLEADIAAKAVGEA